jgi:hypothetical protein
MRSSGPVWGMSSWIKFFRSYIHFLTILFILSFIRKCTGHYLVDFHSGFFMVSGASTSSFMRLCTQVGIRAGGRAAHNKVPKSDTVKLSHPSLAQRLRQLHFSPWQRRYA